MFSSNRGYGPSKLLAVCSKKKLSTILAIILSASGLRGKHRTMASGTTCSDNLNGGNYQSGSIPMKRVFVTIDLWSVVVESFPREKRIKNKLLLVSTSKAFLINELIIHKK